MLALQDDAPIVPRATVVELAVPSGKTLWRRALRYSVLELLVDDAAVYALSGDGRLRALARGTGEQRWGLDVGSASTFAVAKAGGSGERVLVPRDGELAALDPGPGAVPRPMRAYHRVEFAQEKERRNGRRACRSVAVSWLDGGEKVVWRTELPAHARDGDPYECWDGRIAGYRRHPRGRGFTGGYEVLELDRAILLAHRGGLLGLDRASGEIVLDLKSAAGPPGGEIGERFWEDGGRFSLSGDPPCSGALPRWGKPWLLARCSGRVLWFDGSTATLLAGTPLAVEARGVFSWESGGAGAEAARDHDPALERGRARVRASGIPEPCGRWTSREGLVRVGARDLYLDGSVYWLEQR